MAKSLVVTYILWLFGGYFGLHHFYLGRDKQSFLWWSFPGGYFGVGWVRDLWRIPEYVRDANDDPDYLKRLREKMKARAKPPFSLARFVAQMAVGNVFGILVMLAVPGQDEIGVDLYLLGQLIAPLATSVGIWLVGTVGRETGSIKYPLIATYVAGVFFIYGVFTYGVVTLVGTIAFNWKAKKWQKHKRDPPNLCTRITVLTLCGSIYLSLWGSYVYFNMKIIVNDGDEIKFRDALGNFLKSPAVQEFSKNIQSLFNHGLEHGFWSTFQQLVESLDPLGEKNALRVLGLKKGSSQEEIRSKYRELSKKWHPDKFQSQHEKEEAHIMFLEVQQAYEKLSQLKARRKLMNTRPDTSSEDNEPVKDEL